MNTACVDEEHFLLLSLRNEMWMSCQAQIASRWLQLDAIGIMREGLFRSQQAAVAQW